MRIIISPAKKMREDDSLAFHDLPCFLPETQRILDYLITMTPADRQKLWGCNASIAAQNDERMLHMNLSGRLTPAILAYDGIQYQYMAPSVFEDGMLRWVQEHLRILSGFYGVLCPMDGVTPYRLEMQAKAHVDGTRNLYDFWGSKLYEAALPEDRTLLNLASSEYSKAIEKHLQPGDRLITCIFGEIEKGKIVQKGVYAKMARGEMVRYLAEIAADRPEQARNFDRLDYVFHPELSGVNEYVFLREPKGIGPRPAAEW